MAVTKGFNHVATLTTDCDRHADFYKRAFGAEELSRAPDPSGKKVWHSSLRIGSSVLFVNDVFPDMGGSAEKAHLWLYIDNVDAAWKRAVDAGCTVRMPLADMFWGDRWGSITDPFGHSWQIATHTYDMTPEEMKTGQEKAMAEMMAKKPS